MLDEALRARIDALEIAPLDSLLQAHPAVLRTAVHLKHLKSRDIAWPRGTRSGPILQVTNVSDGQMDRALRVLDAVLRASAALGWHFTAPPPQEPPTYRGRGAWAPTPPAAPPAVGHILVEGEPQALPDEAVGAIGRYFLWGRQHRQDFQDGARVETRQAEWTVWRRRARVVAAGGCRRGEPQPFS